MKMPTMKSELTFVECFREGEGIEEGRGGRNKKKKRRQERKKKKSSSSFNYLQPAMKKTPI